MVRVSENEFKTSKLGGVVFVPMIGEHGWPEK
jgi:protein-L-isoaspartate(D-aspartate) O-methyltransferase